MLVALDEPRPWTMLRLGTAPWRPVVSVAWMRSSERSLNAEIDDGTRCSGLLGAPRGDDDFLFRAFVVGRAGCRLRAAGRRPLRLVRLGGRLGCAAAANQHCTARHQTCARTRPCSSLLLLFHRCRD